MSLNFFTILNDKRKELRNFFKEPYFLRTVFLLFATSVVSTLISHSYGVAIVKLGSDLYNLDSGLATSLGTVFLFILIGLLIFIISSITQLKKQNIRNQPSWIFYFYWGIVNTSIIYSILLFSYEKRELWWNGSWWILLIISLVIIIAKWAGESIGQKIDLKFRLFAAGAVGIEDDKLDFKFSAKNIADGLLNLKGYVNVVGLYGGSGFGKSSYARMILENFDENKTLYTYISLTETNEAKDFSKLFAERWLDTLSERYPKINITSWLPFMDSILRESGNGIFSEILKVISAFNRGLAGTKAFFFDEFYSRKKSIFTTDAVAKLFGNITEIKESIWIIMVDEIERAQLEEVYRLVEIVERFRNEGRSGLPTKLLFLFCISEPDLKNYLDAFSALDPRARLLKTFFYEDSKSIAYRVFLPPVDPVLKQKYIFDQLNKIIDREGLDVPKEINPHAIGDPARSFMNHKDALEYTIAVLGEGSPRIISRIVATLDFFYGAFKNRAGELQKNAIRFNDIIALEYIKIKYPYLIDFFVKTIYTLVNQAEAQNIDAYLKKKELEENKIGLIGWIELTTNIKIPESEKASVLKIVGLVMYYYFDFLEKNSEIKTKDKYFGTTSYPEIMYDYLSLMAEGIETNYRKNNRIYQRHRSSPKGLVSSLDNKELFSYARFLFDVQSSPAQLNVDLIKEISNRIVSEKIKSDPMNIGDTALDEAMYQLVFQIVSLAEKERISDYPSDNMKDAFLAIKIVLSSSKLNTGVKYIMLSSLANNERGGGSSIHLRLEEAFKRILHYHNDEIRELIKLVFKEAEKRYLVGKRSLYRYEENFFYTLYQGWSGSKDSNEEIERIRNAAKRDLKKYPQAIKLYWRKYPIGEGWKTLNDVSKEDPLFSLHDTVSSLYMSLETLITITKQSKIDDPEIRAKVRLWEKIKEDPHFKELSNIKDDQSTLKSFLIRNGFLDAEDKRVRLINPTK